MREFVEGAVKMRCAHDNNDKEVGTLARPFDDSHPCTLFFSPCRMIYTVSAPTKGKARSASSTMTIIEFCEWNELIQQQKGEAMEGSNFVH